VLALTHKPKPPLAAYVEMLWLFDAYAPSHGKAQERVLPTGTVELVINLSPGSSQDSGVICGPHSEFFVLDSASQAAVIGVHFHPGGSHPFLGLPASELHNTQVSLETVWGPAARTLRQMLLDEPLPQRKLAILEMALLEKLVQETAHPAVRYALRAFTDPEQLVSIADVTGRIGMSPRAFIQVFSGEVGLTPKLFCRVQRFQAVLKALQSLAVVDWTEVALAAGYYDQAHFIRDFKSFCGLSPTAYMRVRTEHLNHVAL
jgi:AraC-like DNA-binding protein